MKKNSPFRQFGLGLVSLLLSVCLVCAGCQNPSPAGPRNNPITHTGQDLTALAAQAFTDYAVIKAGNVDYIWAINEGMNAYRTIVKTGADVKEIVKAWGNSKLDPTGKTRSLADRLEWIFNQSDAPPAVKAAAIANAAQIVATAPGP